MIPIDYQITWWIGVATIFFYLFIRYIRQYEKETEMLFREKIENEGRCRK